MAICKNCNQEISWNDDARKALQTKRPLNPNMTIHDCPKYQSTAETTQVATPQDTKAAIGVAMNSQDISTDIKEALTAMIQQQQENYTRLEHEVTRLNEIMKLMNNSIVSFIQYNPTERAFTSLIDTLLKYIPASELQPKPAVAVSYKQASEKDGRSSMNSDSINQ